MRVVPSLVSKLPILTMAKYQSQMSSTGLAGEWELFNLRGQQQLFMGVHLCTGPMGRKELLAVLLSGELMVCGELTSSSTSAVEWLSASAEALCEEYKHSAWIQSLLITPETGCGNRTWGGDMNIPTGFADVQFMLKYYICHCLTSWC